MMMDGLAGSNRFIKVKQSAWLCNLYLLPPKGIVLLSLAVTFFNCEKNPLHLILPHCEKPSKTAAAVCCDDHYILHKRECQSVQSIFLLARCHNNNNVETI